MKWEKCSIFGSKTWALYSKTLSDSGEAEEARGVEEQPKTNEGGKGAGEE